MTKTPTGELVGKVAVVTGVGSGLGKATVTRFAQAGAKVVGADIDAVNGTKTIADLREQGLEGTFVQVDVSQEPDVKGMIDTAMSKYGRLDILHNNAGIMPVRVSIEDTPFDEWKRVIAVDLDSVFLGCKYGVAAMKKSGRGGRIMNTASLAGIRAFMWGMHYTAAKAGVVQMSIALSHLVEPDGIKVNAICPTGVKTNLGKGNDPAMREVMRARSKTKTYGPLEPQDIADVAFFLATRAEFTGAAVLVDATPENKPIHFVTFGYKWEPLKID